MQKLSAALKLALGLLALSFITTIVSAEDGVNKEKKPSKAALEKYDENKDGQLSAEVLAKATAASKEKAKHTREENLAKYDANKDGKLDDTEKAAKKADEDAARIAKKAEKDAAKGAKNTQNQQITFSNLSALTAPENSGAYFFSTKPPLHFSLARITSKGE